MSKETSVSGVSSDERNRDEPDYFGYYKCQVVELFSQDTDFELFDSEASNLTGGGSGGAAVGEDSLFSNGVGLSLSDFKRERLKAILRGGVAVLSKEVDKMMGPVVKVSELQRHRRNRKRLARSHGEESEDGSVQARKKLKVMPSTSAMNLPQNSTPSGPTPSVDPKSSARLDDSEVAKVDDDAVQLLLEEDNSELDNIMKKFSNELATKLGYMEQQLEELLDAAMLKCSIMTLAERKRLQKMIKGLPRKNLERIAELVERGKPAEERSHFDIFVNLEEENNVTLWRMYYYAKAFEEAKKLASRDDLIPNPSNSLT